MVRGSHEMRVFSKLDTLDLSPWKVNLRNIGVPAPHMQLRCAAVVAALIYWPVLQMVSIVL